MMSRLYNCNEKWYNNNCLGHSFFLAQNAVFLFDNFIKRHYLNRNRVCAVNKLQRAFGLDIQSTDAVFDFVQSNRNEKAQVLVSPEPWKGLTCMSVKTVSMIASFKVAVKKVSQIISQSFPNGESPGEVPSSASDSILLSLVRRDEPALSSLFPLLAASIVASILSGAASSVPHTSGHYGGGVCQ